LSGLLYAYGRRSIVPSSITAGAHEHMNPSEHMLPPAPHSVRGTCQRPEREREREREVRERERERLEREREREREREVREREREREIKERERETSRRPEREKEKERKSIKFHMPVHFYINDEIIKTFSKDNVELLIKNIIESVKLYPRDYLFIIY
jgi:hypothetical protein